MAISVINFSKDIENLVYDHDIPYIDAVLKWCDMNNIEVEYAGDWIKKDEVIFLKIQAEAEGLNIIKKSANLTSFMV